MRVDLFCRRRRPSAGGGGNGRIEPAADELYYYDYQADGTFGDQAVGAPALTYQGTVHAVPGAGVYGDGEIEPTPFSDNGNGGLLWSENTTVGETAILTVHLWFDLPAELNSSIAHLLIGHVAGNVWGPPFVDWGIYILNDGSIALAYGNAAQDATETIFSDEGVLVPGRHHIAFTTDGESATIYLDGEPVANEELVSDWIFNHKRIVIGGIPISGARYSPGRVGEVRIIPGRALTGADIAAISDSRRTP